MSTSVDASAYRATETLVRAERAAPSGRTNAITGSMEITGTTVNTSPFTVDMTDVQEQPQDRCDDQFPGSHHGYGQLPDSEFERPKNRSHWARGTRQGRRAEGVHGYRRPSTMHGTTKTITFTLNARRTANRDRGAGQRCHLLRLRALTTPERWSGERRRRRSDGVRVVVLAGATVGDAHALRRGFKFILFRCCITVGLSSCSSSRSSAQ